MSALFSFKAQTRANYIIINGITRAMEEGKIQLTFPPTPPSAVCLSKAVTVCPDWGGGDEEISHCGSLELWFICVTEERMTLNCHSSCGPSYGPTFLQPAPVCASRSSALQRYQRTGLLLPLRPGEVCCVARGNCHKCHTCHTSHRYPGVQMLPPSPGATTPAGLRIAVPLTLQRDMKEWSRERHLTTTRPLGLSGSGFHL